MVVWRKSRIYSTISFLSVLYAWLIIKIVCFWHSESFHPYSPTMIMIQLHISKVTEILLLLTDDDFSTTLLFISKLKSQGFPGISCEYYDNESSVITYILVSTPNLEHDYNTHTFLILQTNMIMAAIPAAPAIAKCV